MNLDKIFVSMSLVDFKRIISALEDYHELRNEVDSCRDQIHGLRNLYYDCLEKLAEIQSELSD